MSPRGACRAQGWDAAPEAPGTGTVCPSWEGGRDPSQGRGCPDASRGQPPPPRSLAKERRGAGPFPHPGPPPAGSVVSDYERFLFWKKAKSWATSSWDTKGSKRKGKGKGNGALERGGRDAPLLPQRRGGPPASPVPSGTQRASDPAGGGTHRSHGLSRPACGPRWPDWKGRRAGRVRRREEPGEGRAEAGSGASWRGGKAGNAGSQPRAAARAKCLGAGTLLPSGGARTRCAGRTWLVRGAGIRSWGLAPGQNILRTWGKMQKRREGGLQGLRALTGLWVSP